MNPPPANPNETRPQAQARIDDLLAKGLISREEWSTLFDDLSNLSLWGPEGRRNVEKSTSKF